MKKLILVLFIAIAVVSCTKENTSPSSPGNTHEYDLQDLGKSAHDLLSAETYKTLDIEIQYMPGMQLQQTSVDNLVSFLKTYLNKSTINVTQTQVNSLGKDTLSLNTVFNYELQNRMIFSTSSIISVYILVTDAKDSAGSNVLGTSYLNTSMVLFEKTIKASSGGVGQASTVKIESGVLEHEFGHLLGLVDLGSPMVANHEDVSHAHHCINKNCLMYYEIETSGLMGLSDTPPPLDADCINDLKANGGK